MNEWNLSQDSQCPSQDSDWAPAEYKSRVLTLDQPVQWNFILYIEKLRKW
jgi:hypothetical protein